MKQNFNVIDTVTDIKEGDYEHSLILSYTCSLLFYETLILKDILNNGCYNNSIIIDRLQYDNLIEREKDDVRFCGSYYFLDSISVPGVFHPKMLLLTGKNKGLLLIGSGNDTYSGYGKNCELFYKFTYSDDNRKHLNVFQQAVEYLNRIQRKFPLNKAITERIEMLERETPWLGEKTEIAEEVILHNLDSPLLNQIKELIPGSVKEIALLAPYFDRNLSTVKELKSIFKDAEIKIITQSGNTTFPINYFLSAKEKGKLQDVSLYKSKQKEKRFLHGKVLYFKTPDSEFLFSGSPNISKAAMEQTIKKGNAEMGIFIRGKKKDDLSSLWKNFMNNTRVTTESELITAQLEGIGERETERFIKISNPYIENDILFVDYETSIEGKADILINDNRVAQRRIRGRGNLSLLLKDLACGIEGNRVIQLKIGEKSSNSLWIGNVNIRKRNELRQVSRQLNKWARYVDVEDISRMRSIIEIVSNLHTPDKEDELFKRTIPLTSQEEEGLQEELPRERFYVEEKPEYYNIISRAIGQKRGPYDSLLEIFSSGLLKGISRASRTSGKNKDGKAGRVITDDRPKSSDNNIDEIQGKTNRRIRLIISKFLSYIQEEKRELTLAEMLVINEFLAFLVWLFEGVKMNFNGESFYVFITPEEYMEKSISALERLWLKAKKIEDDSLSSNSNFIFFKDRNFYNLQLAVISLNFWLLNKTDYSFGRGADIQEKLLNIYCSLADHIKRIPKRMQEDMLSIERTRKSVSELIKLPDFNFDIPLYEMIHTRIDSKLIKDRIFSITGKNLEKIEEKISDLRKTLDLREKQLREKKTGLLDYDCEKMKMDELLEKREEIKRAIYSLSRLNSEKRGNDDIPSLAINYFNLDSER